MSDPRYIIIDSENQSDLQDLIYAKLDQGYACQGGVQVTVTRWRVVTNPNGASVYTAQSYLYTQAMVPTKDKW